MNFNMAQSVFHETVDDDLLSSPPSPSSLPSIVSAVGRDYCDGLHVELSDKDALSLSQSRLSVSMSMNHLELTSQKSVIGVGGNHTLQPPRTRTFQALHSPATSSMSTPDHSRCSSPVLNQNSLKSAQLSGSRSPSPLRINRRKSLSRDRLDSMDYCLAPVGLSNMSLSRIPKGRHLPLLQERSPTIDIKRSRSEDLLKIMEGSVSCHSLLTAQQGKDPSPIPNIGIERKIGVNSYSEATPLSLSMVLGKSKDLDRGDRAMQRSESNLLEEDRKKKKNKKYSISMKDIGESPTSTLMTLSEEPQTQSWNFAGQDLSQLDSRARVIQLAFRQFTSRRLENLFHRAFSDETLYQYFSSVITHWRTKRSVCCIRDFLTSCSRRRVKETKLFTVSLLRYSKSVRSIQKAVRDFLACKRARMKVLDKIWDTYELRYITQVIRSRNSSLGPRTENSSLLSFPISPQKTTLRSLSDVSETHIIKLEKRLLHTKMATQDQRWSKIDSKFHDYITKSASKKTLRDAALGYFLTRKARYPYLQKILADVRRRKMKEHSLFLSLQRDQVPAKDAFSLSDAVHLMTNESDENLVDKVRRQMDQMLILNSEANKRPSHRQPFIFFKIVLNENLISKAVQQAHEHFGTFKADMLSPFNSRRGSAPVT